MSRRRRSHQLPPELRHKMQQTWRRYFCSDTWWPSPLDWICLAVGAAPAADTREPLGLVGPGTSERSSPARSVWPVRKTW
mgnify:CR=1 FL=1